MTITATNIEKHFSGFAALDGVSLEARPGEFLALLGPSGSGKTTLLRIMAGLEFPDSGSIAIGGEDMSDRPVRARGVGFVFQQYALFRHMTVADNIAFGLTVRPRATRPTAKVIAARVEELLDLVQLPGLGKRYPAQLSGGQRQRVALARALAVEPRLLLLDEPFGALDAKVRKDLRRWLREIHDRMGLTSVFVTHDQDEALELADRVVVMNRGRIEQVATPEELWARPATAFVCDFLGGANKINCRMDGDMVEIAGVRLPNSAAVRGTGAAVGFVRPHEFTIAAAGGPGVPVILHRVLRSGPRAVLETLGADGAVIEVTTDVAPDGLSPGATIALLPRAVRAFPVAG